MAIPDWQLPTGVDRGLWDYLHNRDMVSTYDDQISYSPLAAADIPFCQASFQTPGRLIDLGCGTGRLCHHMAQLGYDCTGVDLSEEMLEKARENARDLPNPPRYLKANLVELSEFAEAEFDYAACLFSTWGMIRGAENRDLALRRFHTLLKPGGRLVLHVHNRWFAELGWKRLFQGDFTMHQATGGAPLTLHHFTRSEVQASLTRSGFEVLKREAVGLAGQTPRAWQHWKIYGYLYLCEKK